MGTLTLCSTVIVLLLSIIFFLWFELSKPKPELMLPMVILAVAALIGRIVFTVVPQVQPATVLIIIAGYYLGAKYGYICGALVALISNLALGQGLWTPFQMFAWGIIGFIAGLLPHIGKKYVETLMLSAYSFIAAFLFSIITDTLTVSYLGDGITFFGALSVYGAGIIFNAVHGICNLVFIFFLLPLLRGKLTRILDKYSI